MQSKRKDKSLKANSHLEAQRKALNEIIEIQHPVLKILINDLCKEAASSENIKVILECLAGNDIPITQKKNFYRYMFYALNGLFSRPTIKDGKIRLFLRLPVILYLGTSLYKIAFFYKSSYAEKVFLSIVSAFSKQISDRENHAYQSILDAIIIYSFKLYNFSPENTSLQESDLILNKLKTMLPKKCTLRHGGKEVGLEEYIGLKEKEFLAEDERASFPSAFILKFIEAIPNEEKPELSPIARISDFVDLFVRQLILSILFPELLYAFKQFMYPNDKSTNVDLLKKLKENELKHLDVGHSIQNRTFFKIDEKNDIVSLAKAIEINHSLDWFWIHNHPNEKPIMMNWIPFLKSFEKNRSKNLKLIILDNIPYPDSQTNWDVIQKNSIKIIMDFALRYPLDTFLINAYTQPLSSDQIDIIIQMLSKNPVINKVDLRGSQNFDGCKLISLSESMQTNTNLITLDLSDRKMHVHDTYAFYRRSKAAFFKKFPRDPFSVEPVLIYGKYQGTNHIRVYPSYISNGVWFFLSIHNEEAAHPRTLDKHIYYAQQLIQYRDDIVLSGYDDFIKQQDSFCHGYAFVFRGILRYDNGQYEKAIEDYNEALRYEPDDSEIYFLKGLAYQQLGDTEKQQDLFRTGLSLDPWSYYKNNDQTIRILTEEEKEIRRYPLDHVRLNPEKYTRTLGAVGSTDEINLVLTEAYYTFRIGMMNVEQREFERALRRFDVALPYINHPMLHAFRGDCLFELNRTKEAIKAYQIAMEKFSLSDMGRKYWRGTYFFKMKVILDKWINQNKGKVLAELDFIFPPNSKSPIVHANRAYCFFKLGQLNKSLLSYDKALKDGTLKLWGEETDFLSERKDVIKRQCQSTPHKSFFDRILDNVICYAKSIVEECPQYFPPEAPNYWNNHCVLFPKKMGKKNNSRGSSALTLPVCPNSQSTTGPIGYIPRAMIK